MVEQFPLILWSVNLPWTVGLCLVLVTNGLFYWLAPQTRFKKETPGKKDYLRELLNIFRYSITALASLLLLRIWLMKLQVPTLFEIPPAYEEVFFWASLPILIVTHDFYFYWMHRWLHTPWLYRKIHYVHHQSKNPTPLTALSFHFVESFFQLGFYLFMSLLIPIPLIPSALFRWGAVLMDATWHSSFPYLPKFVYRKGVRQVLASPFHHFYHHDKGDKNYGLYFNFWDHLLGTQHPLYNRDLDRKLEQDPSTVTETDQQSA